MIAPLYLFMTWVQTIPLSILLYVPFRDEELKFKRRTVCLLSAAYFFFASIVVAILAHAASVNGMRNFNVWNINMIVILTVFFVGWAFLVRAPSAHKVLVGAMAIHYAAAINMLVSLAGWLFWIVVMKDPDTFRTMINSDSSSPGVIARLVVITAVSYPLVWWFFRRVLRRMLPIMDPNEIRRALIYVCIIVVMFSLATNYMTYSKQPHGTFITLSMVCSSVIVYLAFFHEIDLAQRQAETARQLADYQLQYQTITSRMEVVRHLRHDMRHHLNIIGTLNAQGKNDELTDYLQQYGKVYDQLEQQETCGDPAVDGVLDYYLAQAREENISMDCQILLRGGSGIEHMDMTVLLGNCLENAMDASRRLPDGAGRITVELQPMGAMLLLRVANACEDGEDTDGFTGWEAFPSSKGQGRMGVGLRSISDIAEKYDGSAQFQRKSGGFTTQVSLRMMSEEQKKTDTL